MVYTYYTHNNLNGKGYVGIRKGNPKLSYLGSGKALKLAIKKYGKENFSKTILGEFEDRSEASYWEGFYIKLYKTMIHENGYNIHPRGGIENGGSFKHTKETKEKIRQSIYKIKDSKDYLNKLSESGKNAWQKKTRREKIIKTLPEEWKKNISKGVSGIKHTKPRKPITDERRKQLSEQALLQWAKKKNNII